MHCPYKSSFLYVSNKIFWKIKVAHLICHGRRGDALLIELAGPGSSSLLIACRLFWSPCHFPLWIFYLSFVFANSWCHLTRTHFFSTTVVSLSLTYFRISGTHSIVTACNLQVILWSWSSPTWVSKLGMSSLCLSQVWNCAYCSV